MVTKKEPVLCRAILFDSRFLYRECPIQTCENFFPCGIQWQFYAGQWTLLCIRTKHRKSFCNWIMAQTIWL